MQIEKQTRKQAIKAKCLDCCGGLRAEVRRCPATQCPLWIFRNGTEERNTSADEVSETDS